MRSESLSQRSPPILIDPLSKAGNYAGLRIGVIIRNSTPGQIGNWRSLEQEDAAMLRIEAEGGELAVYDEQGTSGRDLSKRQRARELLDDVLDGVVHGIYAHDVKRLTRDEYGADAGTIAKRLAAARALLITANRDYRLWLKDDLRIFRIEAAIAGGDVLDIRDQLYGGMLTRARHEVFFRNVPPFGYTTRIEEVPGTRVGQPTRIRRVPVKDPAAAAVMSRLAELFETCLSLGEVAHTLNEERLYPPVVKRQSRGDNALWTAGRVRYLLNNPLYGGVWQFGRSRKSTLWEGYHHGAEALRHEVPDLAYWTPRNAQSWKAKLDGVPWRQSHSGARRSYDRPLRGVLVCVSCAGAMVSAGKDGYVCSRHNLPRTATGRGTCMHPQKITHAAATGVLRELLASAIAEWQGRRDTLRAVATEGAVRTDAASQLQLARERLDTMLAEWYGPDAPASVPRGIRDRMAALEIEVERLEGAAAEAEEEAGISDRAAEAIERIEANPLEALDEMTEAERGQAYRLVFGKVRIEASGWANGRTYRVLSYHNQLLMGLGVGTSPYTALKPLLGLTMLCSTTLLARSA